MQVDQVRALLDTLDKALVVADREGRVLMANTRAHKCLEVYGVSGKDSFNLFHEIVKIDAKEISRRIDSGEHEIEIAGKPGIRAFSARVKWMPESDWLAIQFAGDGFLGSPEDGIGLLFVQLAQVLIGFRRSLFRDDESPDEFSGV